MFIFSLVEDYSGYEDMEGPAGEHMFPDPSLDPDALCEGGPSGLTKPPGSIPDFMPSAQRALYLRIQQKQQEEEERARRLAESNKQERENEEGKWQNVPVFLQNSDFLPFLPTRRWELRKLGEKWGCQGGIL